MQVALQDIGQVTYLRRRVGAAGFGSPAPGVWRGVGPGSGEGRTAVGHGGVSVLKTGPGAQTAFTGLFRRYASDQD